MSCARPRRRRSPSSGDEAWRSTRRRPESTVWSTCTVIRRDVSFPCRGRICKLDSPRATGLRFSGVSAVSSPTFSPRRMVWSKMMTLLAPVTFFRRLERG